MQETRVQSLGWEDPLEKEMATQSDILAWKIPWTEEPGILQSRGSQRIGHDGAAKLAIESMSWSVIFLLLFLLPVPLLPQEGQPRFLPSFPRNPDPKKVMAAGAGWTVLLRGGCGCWAAPNLLLLLHGRFSAKGSPWAPQEFRCRCETRAPTRRSSPQLPSLAESKLTLCRLPAASAGPWCWGWGSGSREAWVQTLIQPLTLRQVHTPQGLTFLTCEVQVFWPISSGDEMIKNEINKAPAAGLSLHLPAGTGSGSQVAQW